MWALEPGTVSYSDVGFDFLAYVVAEVSGQYEALAANTVYLQGQYVPLNARGLELVEGNRIELPLYEHKPGAGGLRTSVLDLAIFLSAHMNQGVGSNGARILEAETVRLMHTAARASAMSTPSPSPAREWDGRCAPTESKVTSAGSPASAAR